MYFSLVATFFLEFLLSVCILLNMFHYIFAPINDISNFPNGLFQKFKNSKKYSMAHQLMSKIFDGLSKNPQALPPTYLMDGALCTGICFLSSMIIMQAHNFYESNCIKPPLTYEYNTPISYFYCGDNKLTVNIIQSI